ncbi:MAG: hypothetical protein HYY24_19220 [Verrucomicrobia bacterium]|nr:hypothetical protein [Verrucomicrobiota bacterium]
MTRREFAQVGLRTLCVAAACPNLLASEPDALPTVRWGGHEISRLLLGHNPLKGVAHQTGDLGREMKEYFDAAPARGLELMRRCEELGITTFQMGFRPAEPFVKKLIRDRKAGGGRFQWIATFYSLPQDREAAQEELRQLLQMSPRPIGVQQVGNTTDLLMRQGKLDLSLENLKRFRDAGVLVGLGSHNPEVIDHVESKGWDLDFYQCSFYRSLFGLNAPAGSGEVFEAADRQAMTQVIRRAAKPCLAFKVLGAGRHCRSAETIEAALRFAFQNIKPTDVVLLGMWQKHKDQAAENVALTRRILRAI